MAEYIPMKEVTQEDYEKFVEKHRYVIIEDTKIEIGRKWDIKKYQPDSFELEATTVWSFPKRGDWATHYLNAKYRGNWAPQVPRNLIIRYTEEGDTILDPFVGSGTTLIEAKLLYRNAIGVDINKDAIMVTRDRLNFNYNPLNVKEKPKTWIKTYVGDARNLNEISDSSIDLIATHPPYANIIGYTKNSSKVPSGDLSRVKSVDDFSKEMKKVAEEFYRVLKPGKYCGVLIGDTRRHKHHVPIAFRTMQSFLEAGFILKEDVIKIQHNMKATPIWKSRSVKYNFLLLAHEHLFIFRKPDKNEKVGKYKESMKWW